MIVFMVLLVVFDVWLLCLIGEMDVVVVVLVVYC